MRPRKRPSTPSPKPGQAEPAAEKRGPGRPPGGGYHPSEEQRNLVTVMSGMGIPEEQMVLAILNPETSAPISPVTLRKHFRDELDKGFVQANAKVAAQLYKNATTATEQYPGGVPVAQLFWLKCRARWQQNPERNPPPAAAPSALMNDQETARRLAFVLEKGARSSAAAEPKAAPAKRKKIPTQV